MCFLIVFSSLSKSNAIFRNILELLSAVYKTQQDNLARRGDGIITEIPVSSFGIPLYRII